MKFTQEQKEWLKEKYLDIEHYMSVNDIAALFNETFNESVKSYQLNELLNKRMGLKRNIKANQFGLPMSEEEINFLKENYSKCSVPELVVLLNQTFGTNRGLSFIKGYCREKLGLHRKDYVKTYKDYTQEELDFIRNNCDKMTRKDFAKHFHTSESQIKVVMSKNHIRMKNSGVKKHVAKSKPVGHKAVVNGYVFIKYKNERNGAHHNYTPYARYLYEQAYGKLKDDEMVIFLDGNNRNFDLSNLAVVDKKTNASILWLNAQGKGDLTKAMIEILEIEKIMENCGKHMEELN